MSYQVHSAQQNNWFRKVLLVLLPVMLTTHGWCAPITVAPFNLTGTWGLDRPDPDVFRSQMVGLLEESSSGLDFVPIDPPAQPIAGPSDPNTLLLPPTYRSVQRPTINQRLTQSDWCDQARQSAASVLLMGTLENFSGEQRVVVRGIDPVTNQQLFSCEVREASGTGFDVESQLVSCLLAKLDVTAESTPAIDPSQSVDSPTHEELSTPEESIDRSVEEIASEQNFSAQDHYFNGVSLTNKYHETRDEKYLDGAIAEYRKALALDSTHVESLNNLGTLLHRQGRYEEALAYYLQVLAVDPTYYLAMENAALAYLEVGQQKNAADMFRKALEFEKRPEVRDKIEQSLKQLENF